MLLRTVAIDYVGLRRIRRVGGAESDIRNLCVCCDERTARRPPSTTSPLCIRPLALATAPSRRRRELPRPCHCMCPQCQAWRQPRVARSLSHVLMAAHEGLPNRHTYQECGWPIGLPSLGPADTIRAMTCTVARLIDTACVHNHEARPRTRNAWRIVAQ